MHRDPVSHPSPAEERARYELHENSPEDEGYRRFLAPMVEEAALRLAPGARGLDYGCGPGPALAAMLEERGFPTALYDPHFAPETAVLGREYDFVVCTEAAEHFREPGREFARLAGLLSPGGWLGVMTRWMPAEAEFPDWHYRRDETHLCFYSEETLRRLAAALGLSAEFPRRDLAFLRKPA